MDYEPAIKCQQNRLLPPILIAPVTVRISDYKKKILFFESILSIVFQSQTFQILKRCSAQSIHVQTCFPKQLMESCMACQSKMHGDTASSKSILAEVETRSCYTLHPLKCISDDKCASRNEQNLI